eukprot:1159963-Pelagomonas_calceolata.AAC.3
MEHPSEYPAGQMSWLSNMVVKLSWSYVEHPSEYPAGQMLWLSSMVVKLSCARSAAYDVMPGWSAGPPLSRSLSLLCCVAIPALKQHTSSNSSKASVR